MSDTSVQHQPNKFDIIRSDSKDKYYRTKQLEYVKNALSLIPSINSDQCRLISDCLYYSLTTLLSRQTLGEEAYYLVEFGAKNSIPNLLQRVLLVALKIYVPYITRRVSGLRLLRMFLIICQKFNEVVFMWSRKITYLNLENRLSRINYLSLIGGSSPDRAQNGVGLIAAIKTVNLALFGANFVKQLMRGNVKKQTTKGPVKELDKSVTDELRVDPSTKCSICLEMIRGPTLTSCGHLFCWACVQNYALNVDNANGRFNCPSCRLLIKVEKLIFLHNF